MSRLILAGDVGGTKTWLGLFACEGPRPSPLETRSLPDAGVRCPDTNGCPLSRRGRSRRSARGSLFRSRRTSTGQRLSINQCPVGGRHRRDRQPPRHRIGRLLNDVEAMAHAIPLLAEHELAVIGAATPAAGGNAALIAPGTGLGETGLRAFGDRLVPMPSEGGHTDFAARTPRELELVAMLSVGRGRVALEDVVSGPGLVNLHTFTHRLTQCADRSLPDEPERRPPAITAAALDGRCAACVAALDLFVSALGAAAGNLALRTLATAGLFVGGGIAPRILPALQTGRFIEAFVDKGPMRPAPAAGSRVGDPGTAGGVDWRRDPRQHPPRRVDRATLQPCDAGACAAPALAVRENDSSVTDDQCEISHRLGCIPGIDAPAQGLYQKTVMLRSRFMH